MLLVWLSGKLVPSLLFQRFKNRCCFNAAGLPVKLMLSECGPGMETGIDAFGNIDEGLFSSSMRELLKFCA